MGKYVTNSLPKEVHERIKRQADRKGWPMTKYVAAMVHFFEKTKRDPEDLAETTSLVELRGIKKRIDGLVKIIRGQEVKRLEPLADSVLSIEKSLVEQLGSAKLVTLLQAELSCPKCQVSFAHFRQQPEAFVCSGCSLRIETHIGRHALNFTDLVALLSGGATRILREVRLPTGTVVTGRFFLDESFDLALHEYQTDPIRKR